MLKAIVIKWNIGYNSCRVVKIAVDFSTIQGIENVEYYEDGGVFKYTTASTFDKRQALQSLAEVQELFEDAFIVEFKNGQRIK